MFPYWVRGEEYENKRKYTRGDVDIVLTDKMTWSDTSYLAQLIVDRDVYSKGNGENFKYGAPIEQPGVSVSY